MRNGYLVLGMHRSGTSALSGALAKLGATPPKTLLFGNPDNERGHWESVPLIQFHDELLASAGSKWDDWRPFNPAWRDTPVAAQFRERGRELLRSEFDGAPSFVLKDPRVCRFAPFWLDIFAQEGVAPRLLLPIRQPLEVAQSLRTRDGFSLNKGLLLWLRHTLEAEAATRDLPRAVIDWDPFLKDWRPSLDRAAAELGAPWPRLSDFTAAEVDAFLSAELKHERAAPETARVHPDMHAWAIAAYEALRELVENPGSNSARAALDEVKARFDEATSLFGRALSGFESEIDALRGALAAERHAREQEAAGHAGALEAERAHAAEMQRAHDEELEAERAKAAEMQRVHDQTVSGLQYALATERDTLSQESAGRAEALDAERARVVELQRIHETTLNDLQAALAEKRRAREQAETQRAEALEGERARVAELQRIHETMLNDLQAALAEERRKRERAEAQHAEAAVEHVRVKELQRIREMALSNLEATLAEERRAREQAEMGRAEAIAMAQARLADAQRAHETAAELQSTLGEERQAREREAARYARELDAERGRLFERGLVHEKALHAQQIALAEERAKSALMEQAASASRLEAARLNEVLDAAYHSTSWRISAPVRGLKHAARAIARTPIAGRAFLSKSARAMWCNLPGSWETKNKVKSVTFSALPFVFRRTQVYRNWREIGRVEEALRSDALSVGGQHATKSKRVPLLHTEPPQSAAARIIAFYLPQFHPIPENDLWWGQGFTEWTNVKPAQPQFEGHYQPHEPGDLGYYDLRDTSVQARQIELARLHGVHGFCFYYYWFGGKRLLEAPLENWLGDSSLNFPFCLCWANENWSRRWDGLDSEILVAQNHSPEDDLAFIQDVGRYLRDPRYIRISGKPLLVVYRPNLLPSAMETARIWRAWCRENGIGEIFLAYTQSFESRNPADYGFDAAIEFPPNNSSPPDVTNSIVASRDDFEGKVYDWRVFPERSKTYSAPDYALFRSVCPGWDNTARRKNRGTIFINNEPDLYRQWLENAIADTRKRFNEPDARLVFVNAWNEWAEGAHLEPDAANGYAYLQATRNALEASAAAPARRSVVIVSHDAYPHGAQYLALNLARTCVEAFGYAVEMIVLGDGPLKTEFAKWSLVHDWSGWEPTSDRAQAMLRSLRSRASLALCNTTVSGSIAPALKSAGFTIVSLIHELPDLLKRYDLESAAKAIAASADKVVFPALAVARGFSQFADVPGDKTLIRPQGLYKINALRRQKDGVLSARAALRARFDLPDNAQIVLSVGYADHRKGFDLFIAAGVEIMSRRSDVAFIWIGKAAEPRWTEEAKAAAVKADLIDRFILTGHEEATDVFYAGADVYALTSREDPYPSVALEAMDCGLPVVAFAGTGGMGALIEEAGGINVPAFDARAFAAALDEHLADPQRRARAAAIGPAIIDQDFSFRRYVHDLLFQGGAETFRVSVVVPNYNYARYLVERLDSIRRQTIPIYELIVLDDASTDESASVIEEWCARCGVPHRIIRNAQNSGSVFRQWRKGAELARGDYVWIAEADDIADRDFLAEVLPAFDRSDVVMSYSQSRQIDAEGVVMSEDYLDYVADVDETRWRRAYVANGRDEIATGLFLKNTIPNVSGVVFRRDALLRALVELGDELVVFRNTGDWVVYLTILERGAVAFSPRTLNSHRRHGFSVTLSSFNLEHLREILGVQRSAIRRHSLGEEAGRRADAYAQRLYEQFGYASAGQPDFRMNPDLAAPLRYYA